MSMTLPQEFAEFYAKLVIAMQDTEKEMLKFDDLEKTAKHLNLGWVTNALSDIKSREISNGSVLRKITNQLERAIKSVTG